MMKGTRLQQYIPPVYAYTRRSLSPRSAWAQNIYYNCDFKCFIEMLYKCLGYIHVLIRAYIAPCILLRL